ncbi:MAG TPA: hypothetical protein VL947_06305 [Cytophagales bacterium]|nr:hypothetical protein [Cytophagales bacterium]
MIELFKPNDPFRLILGVVVFIILTLPLIWVELPLTTTSVANNVIGDKINDGFWIYRDIWDYTGIFTSLAFGFTNIFNNAHAFNTVLSLIIIYIIGVQCSLTMNKNEVYNQKNFLTLYFFMLSVFVSFTTLELSAQLMSLLFLSFALPIVLKHFSGHLHDEDRILLGLWHGIASLFYFPSTIFFVLHLLFFAAFTKLKPTSYLLSIFGFVLPYFFICITYYTHGSLVDFVNRGILSYFYFNFRDGIGLENILKLSLPLISVIIFAYFTLFSQNHNNIQSTCKALMFMWFLCFFVIIFWTNFDVYNLCYLCIPFAYFSSYMFLVLKKVILRLILSLAIPLGILGLFWTDMKSPIRKKPEQSIICDKETLPFKDKKLLVLGNDVSKYYHQKMATKYFFWPMAQKHFRKVNTYAGITMVYTSIMEDKPEVIYDKDNLMGTLSAHIPGLKAMYHTSDHKIYYLTK